ncbi:response regulator [Myroides marinus]|uniref:response regulator n=1 Tax=Myroides marinus TaxID=703342 RepID=UPI0025751A62|nr:response regulator transcription factor [Myroides marinus]MDM1377885.1 response regulator transcription factor [Myroides marinus]MDM1383374.1 response regulator transcription factor [Myroides marinus]MDM1385156.1 response regulator transcription factor [Myroides marinus]MDM1392369.1 response regulator transcription factor [Myroides marinus]
MYDKNNIKLAIVDDHPMILEGLKSLLEKDTKFHVFSFTKGAAVIDFIQENKIDVVLLDIVLSDGNGLDFCKIIKQKAPQSIVIALSNQAERSIIFRFLENGGNGYILKNADSQEIIEGIEKALNGDLALSKEVQEIMLRTSVTDFELPRLTKREKQILQAIAKGNTSAEIAEQLFISVITVETHRRNLLQKFKAKNMMELVKIATENQLI